MVFDDFGHEVGVQRTVNELQREGILTDCLGIGQGWNGSRWQFRNWDESTGESFMSWTDKSEGIICKRGHTLTASPAQQFLDQRFYIYSQPLGKLCPAGIFRLLPDGRLETSKWGAGTWMKAAEHAGPDSERRDALLLELPGMAPGPIEPGLPLRNLI